MYIPTPIIKNGFFFSPLTPEKSYPGTITVSSGGRAMLEITATETPFLTSGDSDVERLIGEVEGSIVTLEHCSYRVMSLPFGGMPGKTTLVARTVYEGAGFDKAPTFSSMRFCIDGLSEWLGSSAFKVQHGGNFEDTIIKIKRAERIKYILTNGTAFEINVEIRLPGRPRYPTMELFQQAYITLTPIGARPLEFYQSLTHQLTRFFSFVIGKTVSIHSISAKFDNGEELNSDNSVNIYFQSLNGTEKGIFDRSEMLLGYNRLAPKLEAVLHKWVADYENLRPALHHHYVVQDGSHVYADTKFLAISQAIEAFHRRTTRSSKWPKTEYKAKVKAILDACPADEREWLASKLAHGNEISLADRLHQLLAPFDKMFGDKDFKHGIVRATVNTRNYHAHYDRHGQAKALTGGALVALTYRLRVLFTLNLLVYLGFSENEANDIAEFDYLKKMLMTSKHIDAQVALQSS
ncbi:HEPN domain-containing protein [Pseudomonas viridiflava]|uniref:ApeA N-terminal domain 1-containing protein n=1 Tax=Pseudomonas viridiflava TaxID=33069 RepID=UPI000F06C899|nr:HEPN domain-containing protein [Pseudomonas viridiflava]